MSFFVPRSWDYLARDRTRQTSLVGAGIAGLGTFASSGLRGMPSFRRGHNYVARNGKRQRVKPLRYFSRARRRLAARGGTSGKGFTSEHPRQTIYRKRRMPYRKRRRWVRFMKKVNAVDERELGSRTVVFNDGPTFSTTFANAQVVGSVALYPLKSTSNHLNDLNKISTIENIGNPTQAAGSTVDSTTKFLFHSAVLDITIRNTSHDGAEGDVDIPLEMDLYEILVRAGGPDGSGTTYNKLEDYFSRGAQITLDIGGAIGSSAADINDRGMTPWDLPAALSRSRIKILKKTKFFMGLGQTVTYQVRDPKRRVTTLERMSASDSVTMRGWTKHILMIAKPVPNETISAVRVPRLHVGTTRKYFYKIEGIRESRDFYNRV